jgi:hypothetical protein
MSNNESFLKRMMRSFDAVAHAVEYDPVIELDRRLARLESVVAGLSAPSAAAPSETGDIRA